MQNRLYLPNTTDMVMERLANLHMDPVLQVGETLLETVARRSANLEGITIEKPTPLPPLQWMILGVVGVCAILVWREGKNA